MARHRRLAVSVTVTLLMIAGSGGLILDARNDRETKAGARAKLLDIIPPAASCRSDTASVLLDVESIRAHQPIAEAGCTAEGTSGGTSALVDVAYFYFPSEADARAAYTAKSGSDLELSPPDGGAPCWSGPTVSRGSAELELSPGRTAHVTCAEEFTEWVVTSYVAGDLVVTVFETGIQDVARDRDGLMQLWRLLSPK